MVFTDIATRTYNHNWQLDPIVRSLLDTDCYKLLMLQMVRHLYPDVSATFELINRTKTVRLADVIYDAELRAQFDHARTVRFTRMRNRKPIPKTCCGWRAPRHDD